MSAARVCHYCGKEIECRQVPRPENPLKWRDGEGNYGDHTHIHAPLITSDQQRIRDTIAYHLRVSREMRPDR